MLGGTRSATLSAAAVGASALVSVVRRFGGDAVVIDIFTQFGELTHFFHLPGPDEDWDQEERDAWLDAVWQQVRLVLVASGLLYQFLSPARLPLIVRLLVWPLLLV